MDTKDDEQIVNTEGSEGVVREEKAIASKPKKHWSDKKKKFVLWGGSGLVAVLLVLALVFGFMAVVFKLPGQKVVINSNVCGDETVSAYNAAMTLYIDGDTTQQGSDDLKKLSSDVGNMQNYASDATCLYIRYRVAVLNLDYTVAQESLDAYSGLLEQGRFADGRLTGLSGLEDMKSNVEYMAAQEQQKASND